MSNQLNLARKWRPKTFQEVMGQDVAVNMLRNSLYKNHFFPVYLFAGQRGCGKTSTARILAAAANCELLSSFQSNPQQGLPCLTCASCASMQTGNHPDFIEIDAASHTGVDDVRTLLESCSFMPLLGRKKVYLIDEAHMLSKAAFNALLKVLEEPPAHTLFMLATTEMTKVPETVRSRSFHLNFPPLNTQALVQHLERICLAENVAYETAALQLIIRETDGSARDALNVLEQARFAEPALSEEGVRKVLGIISADHMSNILTLMLVGKSAELLQEMATLSRMTLNPGRLWQLMLQVLRAHLWAAYNVPASNDEIALNPESRKQIAAAGDKERLHATFDHFWRNEELFTATPYKFLFLEKIFLDVCTGKIINRQPSNEAMPSSRQLAPQKPTTSTHTAAPKLEQVAPRPVEPVTKVANEASDSSPWSAFCAAAAQIGDPILSSILQQAKLLKIDKESGHVVIALTHAGPFFIDKINETKERWKGLLATHVEGCTTIRIESTGQAPPPQPRQQSASIANVPTPPPRPAPASKEASSAPNKAQAYGQKNNQNWSGQARAKKPVLAELALRGAPFLLTDDNKAQWPYTTALYEAFPGKLEVVASPEQ